MKATTTKSRSLKTSEFQEKIVGYRTKLKKKKKTSNHLRFWLVGKANMKWKKQLINITGIFILG